MKSDWFSRSEKDLGRKVYSWQPWRVLLVMATLCLCGCGPRLYQNLEIKPSQTETLRLRFLEHIHPIDNTPEVTGPLADMILGWTDSKGRPWLALWEATLNRIDRQAEEGHITLKEQAKLERRVCVDIIHHIRSTIQYHKHRHGLISVVHYRQTQCVGYTQLFTLIAHTLDLNVTPIGVIAQDKHNPLYGACDHVACLVTLSDGSVISTDIVPFGFISRPFDLNFLYSDDGPFLHLKQNQGAESFTNLVLLDADGLAAHALNNRADALVMRGQSEEAKRCADRAMALYPEFTEGLLTRATIQAKLKNYDQAFQDCNRAIELNPHIPLAYNCRATLHVEHGASLRALADFEQAIQLNPLYATVYNNRGTLFSKQGQYKQALADFRHAARLQPDHARALYNQGIAYTKLEDYGKAMASYNRALKVNPTLVPAYVNRAIVHAFLGKKTEARRDLVTAAHLSPEIRDHVTATAKYIDVELP